MTKPLSRFLARNVSCFCALAMTACDAGSTASRAPLERAPSGTHPTRTAPAGGALPRTVEAAPSSTVDAAPVPTAPESVVQSSNAFASSLYAKVSTNSGNLFLSPVSIFTALGMTYGGARGETAKAMEETLVLGKGGGKVHDDLARLRASLVSTGAKGPEIRIANRLWGARSSTIEPAFLKLTEASYGAPFGVLDFARDPSGSRSAINRWVEGETKGKIVDLLPSGSVTELTLLVLTNAIYFKGTWVKRFDKSSTRSEPFSLTTGDKIQVPMMHADVTARYSDTDSAQALELPYDDQGTGRKFSMVVLLPKQVKGLPEIEAGLTQRGLSGLVDGLKKDPVAVRVSLPRFKLTWEMTLNETLKSMGMNIAFVPGQADFSGVARTQLHIHWVQHKAFVEVNEEGTEAAAATAVVLNTKSLRPKPQMFQADRPFLFLIRDVKTGTILFMGRVSDPTKSA